jgi:alpha-amylase
MHIADRLPGAKQCPSLLRTVPERRNETERLAIAAAGSLFCARGIDAPVTSTDASIDVDATPGSSVPAPTPTPTPTPAPPGPTTTAALDHWRGRSIYFVVTDRFANGDPGNDDADATPADRADPAGWHGGDFRGLIDHLDYIADLGFTALWITPVIQQRDRHAYHGYWGWDFSRIDGHLGDLATLRKLVEQAHARGIA